MATSDQQRRIELLVRSPALRSALELYLTAELGTTVLPHLNEAGPGVLVLTTSSDATPADCGRLVRGGARVLVLMAFASDRIAEEYRAAGTNDVLLMGADGLVDALRAGLRTDGPKE